MARISAWAVGSFVEVTRFQPRPMICLSRTMTAPNGPPSLPSIFSTARRMASRKKAGFIVAAVMSSFPFFPTVTLYPRAPLWRRLPDDSLEFMFAAEFLASEFFHLYGEMDFFRWTTEIGDFFQFF